jgi:hypothetical protein
MKPGQDPIPARRGRFLSLVGLEIVVLGDVRDAYHQNAHSSTGTVNHPRRDVDQRPLGDRVLDAVQNDAAAALQQVLQCLRSLAQPTAIQHTDSAPW